MEEKPDSGTALPLTTTVSKLVDKVLLGIEPSPQILSVGGYERGSGLGHQCRYTIPIVSLMVGIVDGKVMVVYFVQGAIGLSRLATTYFLKDDLGLSPAEAGALMGLFTLPWLLKVSEILMRGES